MVALLSETAAASRSASAAAWQRLPARMRVLYIATRHRTGGWLAEAFAADSASRVVLEEAVGMGAGLARLRDEVFDAVLVSHEPEELNALDMIEGYRAGGADEPIVVLGTQSEQEMAALCHEVGADGYVCVHTATTRNLIWVIAQAVQRHQIIRENQRLLAAEQARLQREHDEAACLLQQQRSLLQGNDPQDRDDELLPIACLPTELIDHYRELLRTYVIMGSGNLSRELRHLAELLGVAGLSARQTLQLHLHVLAELIQGLGSRSTRHVMNRADLLALELLLHVGDGYRRRYQERVHPPLQKTLPGF
jgi:DNA-binding NarL/FixJ family response regulator